MATIVEVSRPVKKTLRDKVRFAAFRVDGTGKGDTKMRIAAPSVELPHRPLGSVTHLLIVAMVALCVPYCPVLAATLATGTTHAAFILFADHYMPEAQWSDLLTALRQGLATSEPKNAQRRESMEVLRGGTISPGLQLDQIVAVYLHGDCVLLPAPRTTATGALGWVYRAHGQILPFIHVDCAVLSQMLGPMALTLTRNRRHQIMAEAIARVVMHEWVHIATQSAAHASDGITKSTFGIADLLADDEKYRRHPARFTSRRWPMT